MNRSRSALVIALLLLVTNGCSSGNQISQDLDGHEYWSTNVMQDGQPFPLAGGTTMTLTFTDGTLRAHAGCNSIGGAFTIEDGKLRTTQLSMTEMGCDPERHAQDQFLIDVLSGAPTVTVDGNTLRLVTSTASIDFVDAIIANPDLPLQGTSWEIDGLLSGQTASSFATDVRGTIRIDNDTMRLFDGCATVDLLIEINAAEIRFEPVAIPVVDDCAAPAGYRQSIFTALSRGALEYVINGTNLTMTTPDNVGFTLKAAE
ncbi:MAG: META domain-containing protein [Acidimicrobiaceae bacterium]|nr:META domain-containing protein [Acidimicrobiaceae bacterium]